MGERLNATSTPPRVFFSLEIRVNSGRPYQVRVYGVPMQKIEQIATKRPGDPTFVLFLVTSELGSPDYTANSAIFII